MPFSTYVYKTLLSSPRAAEARKSAFCAIVRSLGEKGNAIQGEFGIRDWVVVV
jgi:hypothetical protein